MGVIVIVVIVIGVLIFWIGSEDVKDYSSEPKPTEWNPPRPQNIPDYPEKLPPSVQCRCTDCKYLYSGTKTEYNYGGTRDITTYRGLCLRTGLSVDAGQLPPIYENKGCSLYAPKTRK